ncbi:MAG: phosphoenolpyruvate synthase [bacterium]
MADKVMWLSDIGRKDVPLAGGKGANLGEMIRSGFPVPPGFVVTSGAYYSFIIQNNLSDKIWEALRGIDMEDSTRLQAASRHIKQMIVSAAMPDDTAGAIKRFYNDLVRNASSYVAVRSSATAEDLPEASFAGQQESFLNISGEDNIVEAVQRCWASLWDARAIYYRDRQGFDQMKIGIAVPVQRMVEAEVSGVAFTVEPVSGNRDKIYIEAAFGLGEVVVGGKVDLDSYIVDKKRMEVEQRHIAKQAWQLIRADGDNRRVDLSSEEGSKQKLSDDKIIELADIAGRLEEHYDNEPQDIEWAMEKSTIYIVQTRPVTTLKRQVGEPFEIAAAETGATSKEGVILSGVGASPGRSSGPVHILHTADEVDELKDGEVLVAVMTNPDFVPAMRRAAAIITDAGGRTSHAAIVSRELGVPCIVGTNKATSVLKKGQMVTVDGSRGTVSAGTIAKRAEAVPAAVMPVGERRIVTGTRLYVNLSEPERAAEVAAMDVDGVGLLRAEFMIAGIGRHPRALYDEGKGDLFIDKLSTGLAEIAAAFYPRPVFYRTTDFKTNEYHDLEGGDKYEENEANPMLGYRGISRYIREPEIFGMELSAVNKVRQDAKLTNLHLMLPFVRKPEELKAAQVLMGKAGLARERDFKLWIMVEVPSTLIRMDDFIDCGIDGVSIGSNDLTQLVLGIDRDSRKLASEFDERDEAVLRAMHTVVDVCRRRGVTSSICGQAPSFYPELVEMLVGWGITSISINPDAVERTKRMIAASEVKLLLESALERQD